MVKPLIRRLSTIERIGRELDDANENMMEFKKRSEETTTQRAEWQEEDMNVACGKESEKIFVV